MVYVFSFSLYGPENPLYYKGLLENIYLAGKYFPSWKVYVYLGADVTPSMKHHLSECSSVVIRETGLIGHANMVYRFFAIDEPEVEIMMVRDADSRIHWKDRWAIRDFESNQQFIAHTIRDNVVHTAHMMGGLWGMRKNANLNIQNEYEEFKRNPFEHGMGHDQNFLSQAIYPKVKHGLLVHYSNERYLPGEHAVKFPFEWKNDVYCGRVEENYLDLPDPVPIKPKSIIHSLPAIAVRIYK